MDTTNTILDRISTVVFFSIVQGLFNFIFNWMRFKLYFKHLRMFKCVKMNVNEIIAMVSNIESIHIVPNVSFNFYFVFTSGHGDATARIAIMINTNNHGVLLKSFTIGAIYAAVLENQIVKYSKKIITPKVNVIILAIIFLMMMLLIMLRDIFEILLSFKVIFILLIGLIAYVFYLPDPEHQNLKEWNQSLKTTTMCYFDLSCNDQFIFNCVRMFKLYFQQLNVFLFHFVVLFLYQTTLQQEKQTQAARETTINNILLWMWFSVTTISVRYIIHVTTVSVIGAYKNVQKIKNSLHLNGIDDLYDLVDQRGITANGDTKSNVILLLMIRKYYIKQMLYF